MATPFQFDTSFDDIIPVVEQTYSPPTFTEEELMAAKEIAYSKGLADGESKQAKAIEADLVKVLIGMEDQLVKFIDLEAKRRQEIQFQAAQLAKSVALKICITESEKYAVDRVVNCMEKLTKSLINTPSMAIRVHSDIAMPLGQRVSQMIDEGKVHINVDDSLSRLDCQFDWADGGAEVILQKTLAEVDSYIEQITD